VISLFSHDVDTARENENQNTIQKETSWSTGVKGMKLCVVEQSSLEDQWKEIR